MAQGKLDTSVLSRLNKVERELKQAKEGIRKRDQEIKDLKMKLAKSKGGDKDHMTQYVSEMRAELAEMKAFLNDYGMVWIGGRVGQQSGGSSKAGQTRDDSRGQGGKEVTLAKENVRLIQTRVKELNEMVGDDTKAGGEREMETLTLFKDGITFHDKPFRPFSDKSAQLVIRDLVDGYFPQELKSAYPEGVKIRLVSKIDQTYEATVKKAASKPKPMSNIRQLSNLNEDEEPEASTQSFLEKVPKTVIHNGKIVQMREEIGSLVHLEEKKVPEKMPIHSLFTQKLNMADLEKFEDEDGVGCHDEDQDSGAEEGAVAKTVIQVKREDGMQTYVLKFPHWATIQDVRNALDTHRRKDEGTSSGDYVLRSAFPPQVYKDVHQTLESAGLVPNATLFMKTT